ncbi:MAG: histidine kinase [Acidobacteriota bacterium]
MNAARAIMPAMVSERRPGPSNGPSTGDGAESPLLARRSFWLTTAAIWSYFGLMVANQLYFSMRGHGHDWWRILLWQMAGASTWMLLSPLVFALESRFPVVGGLRSSAVVVHLLSATAGSLVRMVPMAAISLVLDPYRPVPTKSSFGAEYMAQAFQWLYLDLSLYGVILVAASVYRIRARAHRDQLHTARLEKELASAELRALKLELQPHFLFNTMNAIVSLVRTGDSRRAEGMLLGLCDLLRSTLDDHRRQLVPLAEEIEITGLYIGIQRVRFGDRLDFSWRLGPGVEDAIVPALLLQPVIENAVRHAVELGLGRGRIEVEITRLDDELSIAVEDDGPQTDPGAGALLDGGQATSRGLGLENVRGRLSALYGNRWHLDLVPRAEGGTRVNLRFPWSVDSPTAEHLDASPDR